MLALSEEVSCSKAAMLFIGLYMVALGVGGIKGSLPVHGAEQLDKNTARGRKQRSTFFNYFVFCLACGALVAVTFVVWIEDNKGWQWGFGISTAAILVSIPIFLAGSPGYRNKIPTGSPFTTIAKVLMAATTASCIGRNMSNAVVSMPTSPSSTTQTTEANQMEDQSKVLVPTMTAGLTFLNRAATKNAFHPTLECTAEQVEEVKMVFRVLPIFACTIMLNCCLAQLSTFSVQQAATTNTKIGSLRVPPALLPVFPVRFIMIIAPLYDHVIIPFARRVTRAETGITQLQRIGIGLVLSIVAMALAALVEVKRKRVATDSGLLESRIG
ncbi:hypothetical protein Syun_020892 [Stephania yunnanensis]|uniref:Uncharacterized protein n=1 Tax=Stephania yunnanensis TaxID=152371 RepID=A0AAP0IF15_9MAGN